MAADLDVIKIGAWMLSNNHFKDRQKLYIYWITISIFGTIVQLYFFYLIIKNVNLKIIQAMSSEGLTD
jgi:hypothetical protein